MALAPRPGALRGASPRAGEPFPRTSGARRTPAGSTRGPTRPRPRRPTCADEALRDGLRHTSRADKAHAKRACARLRHRRRHVATARADRAPPHPLGPANGLRHLAPVLVDWLPGLYALPAPFRAPRSTLAPKRVPAPLLIGPRERPKETESARESAREREARGAGRGSAGAGPEAGHPTVRETLAARRRNRGPLAPGRSSRGRLRVRGVDRLRGSIQRRRVGKGGGSSDSVPAVCALERAWWVSLAGTPRRPESSGGGCGAA